MVDHEVGPSSIFGVRYFSFDILIDINMLQPAVSEANVFH
jgi:hypothetical protein